MPISGTYEADGRVWKFRKPHVGPVLRFNDTLALAEAGEATKADILKAALTVIHDAVARIDPKVTRDEIEGSLDEDDILGFQRAIIALSNPAGAETGEG